MAIISKGRVSLQTKFGFSYILVIVIVLLVLNIYPLRTSQNMIFRSKETSISSSVKVIEAALSGLEELNEDNVTVALSGLKETGVSRIMVTDTAGRIIFDTRETGGAVGLYAFYTEVAEALEGNDAFYCAYDSTAFLSRAASPVVYHNQIIGAVYAYEYDTEQANLLKSFQNNLLSISGGVAIATILLSFILGKLLTGQISSLLSAIQNVREGSYGARAKVTTNDEIGEIATAFNSLSERLEKIENSRRRFVSDASHELKTPLAGIRLMTDSILQTENMDMDTTKEFVSDIGQEADRLTHITEDLLRISKLDNDVPQKLELVPVTPVLERVVRMLRIVAKEKEITVSYDADELAAIMGTEDDLHQILYNLMENGIKYSKVNGFVHTNVTIEDDTVVFSVEDHGIGIPKKDLPHIFDRFYRVNKDRSRAMGGTGLGLAIVKDTVEKLGGTISAAERPGGGSVFTVRLPLVKGGDET